MRNHSLRTIGASVILAGVVIAGIAQIGSGRLAEQPDIVAYDPTTLATEHGFQPTSTTTPSPFVYRVAVLSGLSTDNFWAFYGEQPSVWNSYIVGPTKPALFTFDASLGTLQAELAASETNPVRDGDGWRVRVDLNTDLAWSDGAPVTADDLVFTFDTVRDLDLGGSWEEAFPESVAAIHAVGEHRVRIEFSERPPLSVWPHGVGLAPIMARHVWEQVVEDATAETLYDMSGDIDVSGGPLAITSVSDRRIVSHANAGYPLVGGPDTVEYHIHRDAAAAVRALTRGDVDTVLSPSGLASGDLAAVGSIPGVELVTSPGNGIRYLGFNLERAPMSDRAFRTAIALLLERETLAEDIPHTGAPAWSLVPEANTRWYEEEAAAEIAGLYRGPLADRLAAALTGLESAGYTWETEPSVVEGTLVAGTGLTIEGQPPQPLTILTPGDAHDPARPDYASEIAAMLGILGFDARPVETDFDTVVDLAFTPGDDGVLHYDMYLLGWTLGNPALPGYHGTLFATDGEMNNTGYASEAFDTALAAYAGAFTPERALEALWDMERTLAVDLPYLPLYTGEITEAYRSDRVDFDIERSLGGLQARLGGIRDVRPTG